MNKLRYINSLSLHFYAIALIVFLLLCTKEISICTLLVTILLLLPLVLSYLYRIKDMSEEEIVEKFGFTGNKFLDPNYDE